MGCWYLVEDSKLPNTNNPRPTTHDQQTKLISKSLKSLGLITLKSISKTRLNRLNIGKFAIMSTKSRVANSVKWLKGKGPQKVIVRSSLCFSCQILWHDTIQYFFTIVKTEKKCFVLTI